MIIGAGVNKVIKVDNFETKEVGLINRLTASTAFDDIVTASLTWNLLIDFNSC